MRSIVTYLIGVMVVAGCAGPAPSAAPTAALMTPAPSAAPLAIGEFTSHGVATKIDARGAGANVTGTMTLSDSGQNATVDLECSRTTESGALTIGGLVTESTFTEWFPKGHRVAIILQPGSPVKAVWYIVLPGDDPIKSCQLLVEDHIPEASDQLEPIQGTLQLGP